MEGTAGGQGAAGHGSGPSTSAPSHLDAHDHTRLWLQSKLAGDWSAQTAASGLTEERLHALSRTFGSLDSMVKVRLLLAGLFVPRAERPRLQPLLQELSGQAAGSQDEWVRATAAAVGDFSGPLDMRALMAHFPLVRDTMTGVCAQLTSLNTPPALLPQAEQYMHGDISRMPACKPQAATAAASSAAPSASGPHFRLRQPPVASLPDLGLLPGAQTGSGLGGGLAAAGPAAPGAAAWGAAGAGLGPGGASSGAGAAGGTALEGRGGLGSALGVSGSDPMARRGLGGRETSVLRSRADLPHGKEGKAPPTPRGGAVVPPGPSLNLRLNRTRSLVGGPEGESPHPTSATAAGQPLSATAAAAAAAAAAGSIFTSPNGSLPSFPSAGGAGGAAGAAASALPPLPPGAAGAAAAGGGGGAAAGMVAVGAASGSFPPPLSLPHHHQQHQLPPLQLHPLTSPQGALGGLISLVPLGRRDSLQGGTVTGWPGAAATTHPASTSTSVSQAVAGGLGGMAAAGLVPGMGSGGVAVAGSALEPLQEQLLQSPFQPPQGGSFLQGGHQVVGGGLGTALEAGSGQYYRQRGGAYGSGADSLLREGSDAMVAEEDGFGEPEAKRPRAEE